MSMTIFIGRGGTQKQPLAGIDIAPLHCSIKENGDGTFSVAPLNYRPTIVDGERVWKSTEYDGDSVLTVGESFEMKLSEAAQAIDAHNLTDWGMMADRFGDLNAITAFDNVCLWEYEEDTPNLIDDNAMCARAYYLMREGKLREAQEQLYEAGDDLYARQDGTPLMHGAYAGMLGLLAELYVRAGRSDVARQAHDGARQLLSMGAECSERVRKQIEDCGEMLEKGVRPVTNMPEPEEYPEISEDDLPGAQDYLDLSSYRGLKRLKEWHFTGKVLILPGGVEEIGDDCLGWTDHVYAPATLKRVGKMTRVGLTTTAKRLTGLENLNQCVLNVAYEDLEAYKAKQERLGVPGTRLKISEEPYTLLYFYAK